MVAIQAVIWASLLHLLVPAVPDFAAPLGSASSPLGTSHLVASAAIGGWISMMGGFGGTRLRMLVERMVERAQEARRSEVAARTEHAGELAVLAAEVAHELKNPLASIKLLSSLVAKEVDGKSAERLSVLREEVDRLQTTLDEFLNFSRPLVPLAIVEADANALCADVARLHEGAPAPLEVMERVAAPVRCDPRKLRQVLVNLVQNAIDASPAGAAVELATSADAHATRIEVRDRGPGVDPELLQRVFDPGVTSKAGGHGIGLTVARALCAQHGGTLELLPRDGGGTRAVVVLPRGGPA
jgi:signal transduction histidine kinase